MTRTYDYVPIQDMYIMIYHNDYGLNLTSCDVFKSMYQWKLGREKRTERNSTKLQNDMNTK